MYKIHICIFFSKFQILPSSFCPLILLDIYVIFGRKVMTHLDSIFKSRDITLPTKVCLVKAMVIPVVMYGCESWTVKKAEHRRIDAFDLWWETECAWASKDAPVRPQLAWLLKGISPGCSLKGMMLKLKLQYFGPLMRRVDSLAVPSLWVIPVHQPQASCIMHQTWIGDSFHI